MFVLEGLMLTLIAFLPTLIVSIFVNRLVLSWLEKRAIMDMPNERSSHTTPVPRGGGIGIWVSFLLNLLIIASLYFLTEVFHPNWIMDKTILLGLVITCLPILLLLAVSFLDDLKGLSVRVRFGSQLILSIFVVVSVLSNLEHVSLLQVPDLYLKIIGGVFAVLFIVWFTNLYNFMDGIDGITSVQTISILLGLVIVPYISNMTGPHDFLYELYPTRSDELQKIDMVSVALLAAVGGFLAFNWSPAKMFMGDVGSIPLGFFLGTSLILFGLSGYWAAALIIPAYYLGDATLTLLRRIFLKQKIWEAHRMHFYQQAVDRGWSHQRVVLNIFACNMFLLMLAVFTLFADLIGQIVLVALAGLFVLAFLAYLAKSK